MLKAVAFSSEMPMVARSSGVLKRLFGIVAEQAMPRSVLPVEGWPRANLIDPSAPKTSQKVNSM
jgi:hypothetical protein